MALDAGRSESARANLHRHSCVQIDQILIETFNVSSNLTLWNIKLPEFHT